MLDFDEINSLVLEKIDGAETQDDVVDGVLDILISAYLLGAEAVEDMLDYRLDTNKDLSLMNEVIYKPIEGKTFEDRVREYAENGSIAEIQVVATTEAHRIFSTSADNTALAIEKDSKREVGKGWQTMADNAVRETHNYLEDKIVPLDEKFYTYDGDSAYYPGGFEKAENNIGCRCWLEYRFI